CGRVGGPGTVRSPALNVGACCAARALTSDNAAAAMTVACVRADIPGSSGRLAEVRLKPDTTFTTIAGHYLPPSTFDSRLSTFDFRLSTLDFDFTASVPAIEVDSIQEGLAP